MAAVARPPVASGNSGVKAALIAFVCLTVASLGAFVYLFTLQSDNDKKAADAESRATAAQKSADEANAALSDFAKDVIGKPTNTAADIQKEIDPLRAALARDE